MTCTKSFARRCNDKYPQLLAFGQIIELALQGAQHLFAQCVESGWPIQGEGAHAAIVVVPKNQGSVWLYHGDCLLNSVGIFGAFAQLEFLYFASRGFWNFLKANFFGHFVAG
jgi:hypothetical protein